MGILGDFGVVGVIWGVRYCRNVMFCGEEYLISAIKSVKKFAKAEKGCNFGA